ncbi:MAG: hypothetical protein HY716_02060 [Planctomycetes bacterium]|nr:hypothetical protein [Planctomycetota bacterium]
MIEFHKIWIEQCEGARGVKEEFGTEKALGYLIGEKLVNFIRASDTRPEFSAELPNFVAEVKLIFEPHEIRGYLENVRRIGAMGHVATDEEFEFMRKAGAFNEDPVRGAADVLLVERIREMLLE